MARRTIQAPYGACDFVGSRPCHNPVCGCARALRCTIRTGPSARTSRGVVFWDSRNAPAHERHWVRTTHRAIGAFTHMTTRRSFLSFLGTLPLGACSHWSTTDGASQTARRATADGPGTDAMNEALEILRPYAPSFRGGLSNHGPMTAEALVALGHHDAVLPWIERYRKQLEPRLNPHRRITSSGWRDALGDRARIGDWEEWFTNHLKESLWPDVLARWIPRLAPGMAAAGLHGVIRVGHAVCSLAAQDNELRRDELARALAYWAAEYMSLPGRQGDHGELAPSEALLQVQALPDENRRSRGLIATQLGELAAFANVINLVDPSAGSPSNMSDLISTFAGTFANTTANSFDFLHAVTGSAAVAELLPYVAADDRDLVRAYTWQATAAIFARYSRPGLSATLEAEPEGSKDFKHLAKLAVDRGDAHTIKLAAACRREWLRNPDPRLLAAATRRVRKG